MPGAAALTRRRCFVEIQIQSPPSKAAPSAPHCHSAGELWQPSQAIRAPVARPGSSTAIGKNRSMSNPTGLQCHMHRNDTGLVRGDSVLSSWERKLEVEGAEFGLFGHDSTASVDHHLYGMRKGTPGSPVHSPATPNITPRRGLSALGDVVEPPQPAKANPPATYRAASHFIPAILAPSASSPSL